MGQADRDDVEDGRLARLMAVLPVELSLRWGAGGIEGVGLSAQAEVAEDAANGAWVGDGRDHGAISQKARELKQRARERRRRRRLETDRLPMRRTMAKRASPYPQSSWDRHLLSLGDRREFKREGCSAA